MTIFPDYDFDTGQYRLMVRDGRLSPMPAGPRLFRTWPQPVVKWTHEDEASAVADAAKVQKYLDELPARKQTKKELREVGA